jgi:hypothetical protein
LEGCFILLKRLAPGWAPHSRIAIYNHPHPGSPPWRWSYCQQLFNIFIPEAHATVALDTITSDTAYVYRFEKNRLIEVRTPEQIRPAKTGKIIPQLE